MRLVGGKRAPGCQAAFQQERPDGGWKHTGGKPISQVAAIRLQMCRSTQLSKFGSHFGVVVFPC